MGGILSTNDLDHIVLGFGQLVILDDNALTLRVVDLRAGQIADNGVNRIGVRGGVGGQSIGEQDGQALKDVSTVG